MCEYCEGKSEIINTLKYDIEYYDSYPSAISTGCKVYVSDNTLVVTNQQLEDKAVIKYCPMCGQRLGE